MYEYVQFAGAMSLFMRVLNGSYRLVLSSSARGEQQAERRREAE